MLCLHKKKKISLSLSHKLWTEHVISWEWSLPWKIARAGIKTLDLLGSQSRNSRRASEKRHQTVRSWITIPRPATTAVEVAATAAKVWTLKTQFTTLAQRDAMVAGRHSALGGPCAFPPYPRDSFFVNLWLLVGRPENLQSYMSGKTQTVRGKFSSPWIFFCNSLIFLFLMV